MNKVAMEQLYTEERLKSLKSQSASFRYGAHMMLKYPERFNIFKLYYKLRRTSLMGEFRFIDEINEMNHAELLEILELFNEYYVFDIFVDVISEIIINEELGKRVLLDFARKTRLTYTQNSNIMEEICNSLNMEITIDDIKDIDLTGGSSLVSANKIIGEYVTFTEEYYMNNYKNFPLSYINKRNNPWANPWAASEDFRLFVILNNLNE